MSRTLAVITAAGLSTRAGKINKLCYKGTQEKALIYQTFLNLHAASIDAIQILLPPEKILQNKIKACFPHRPKTLSFKIAPKARNGLSQTIQSGVKTAITHNYDNLMIVLGDMPHIPPQHYRLLLEEKTKTGSLIAATSFNGRCQAPIIWDKKLFQALLGFDTDLQRRDFVRKLEKRSITTVSASSIDIHDYDTYQDLLTF